MAMMNIVTGGNKIAADIKKTVKDVGAIKNPEKLTDLEKTILADCKAFATAAAADKAGALQKLAAACATLKPADITANFQTAAKDITKILKDTGILNQGGNNNNPGKIVTDGAKIAADIKTTVKDVGAIKNPEKLTDLEKTILADCNAFASAAAADKVGALQKLAAACATLKPADITANFQTAAKDITKILKDTGILNAKA